MSIYWIISFVSILHCHTIKKEQRPKRWLSCRSCTFTLLILRWLFSVKRLVLPYYCTCLLQYCITGLHFWPQFIFLSLQDIPPPGSYDISTSFHRSQLKRDPAGARTDSGKLRRGAFLTSQSRFAPPRDVHIVESDPYNPGPCSLLFSTKIL